MQREEKSIHSIWDLGISEHVISVLDNSGILTIEQLLSMTDDEVADLFSDAQHSFFYLRSYLHQLGLTFRDEFEQTGLTPEQAIIPLSNLPLSENAVYTLDHRYGVYTLGELLTTRFDEIVIQHPYEVIRDEVEAFVQSIGCSLRPPREDKQMKLRGV